MSMGGLLIKISDVDMHDGWDIEMSKVISN